MYIILNLARVLAYIRDGSVLSKKEGGEWALDNIPEKYHCLLGDAMREYGEGTAASYDPDLMKDYARYMLGQITGLYSPDSGMSTM